MDQCYNNVVEMSNQFFDLFFNVKNLNIDNFVFRCLKLFFSHNFLDLSNNVNKISLSWKGLLFVESNLLTVNLILDRP